MPAAPYRDDPEAGDFVNPTESDPTLLHVHTRGGHSEHGDQIPVWLEESTKKSRYRWIPRPIRKAAGATVRWVKGPVPPRVLKISPIFPTIQEAPIKFMDKYVPKRKHRALLYAALLSVWFLVWALMVNNLKTAGYIEGIGTPDNIACDYSFWEADNGCGLNGDNCRPFSSTSLGFKCPANCLGTHLTQKYWVGNQSHQYTDLVVGGPSSSNPERMAVYRGDSYVCQAAVHAGIIKASTGGCGIATLVGAWSGFEASTKNEVTSFDFPSSFPRNYDFPDPSTYYASCPADSRWGIFVVTAVTLVLLSLFTTSPAAFFFGTFFVLIFHIGFVSDPPPSDNFSELMSTFAARLFPASFIAAILYRYCAVPLLTGVTAQVEKTVLYLGVCFIGALNNYTFEPLIPIQRLTPTDLAEPGAKQALAIIVTIILLIVGSQIHFIRVSGNMPRYLIVYALICGTLLLLLALPGERLRIHHYILGVAFMPGTFTKNRGSLAYQGLLLGLFANGVAKWGFASIIQTPAALGETGSSGAGVSWWGATAPNVTATILRDATRIRFDWGTLPNNTGIDGVSVLINDVERWRGYVDDELFWNQTAVTLGRGQHWFVEHEPEYFRFAWMNGGAHGTYSDPGVWDVDDAWHPYAN